MDKIYKNFNFKTIHENGNMFFCKTNSSFAILKEKNNDVIDNVKIGNIEYISRFESNDGSLYELLIFNENIDQNIAFSFFNILVKLDSDLPKTLSDIARIFSLIYNEISLWKKRGIFAELYSIKKYNLRPRYEINSIYDMIDHNGNDVEIKSFSRTKREIKISYQQLVNNDEATFYIFEVIESSTGLTIIELYNDLTPEQKQRYSWIEYLKEDSDKFLIDDDSTIMVKAKKLNIGLSLPELSKNATFIFDLDLIKNIN